MTVIRSFFRNTLCLVSDTRGVTAVVMAVSMATLVGFAGLGVETGLWFSQKREYQTAADAAAISGAFQLANGNSLGANCSSATTTIWGAGCAMALNNGYSSGTNNSITINEGNWNGTTFTANGAPLNAVQAVISERKNSLLSVAYISNVTIRSSAVALVQSGAGHGCVFQLGNFNANSSNNAGISVSGSSGLNLGTNCSVVANATGPDSINVNGGNNNQITAYNLFAAGDVNFTGTPNYTLAAGQIPVSQEQQQQDPYSSSCTGGAAAGCDPLPAPPVPTGSNQNGSLPSKSMNCPASPAPVSLQPGQYTNGMDMSVCTSYTMAAGTYYVSGGDVVIKGSNVTGSNVTVVLTSTNSKSASVQISSNATGSLTEPTSSGTYSGVLFYQYDTSNKVGSINSCSSPANSINANGGISLEGLIYMPSQPLCFQGTPTTIAGHCLQLYSYQISIGGNPTIDDTGCPASTTGSSIKQIVLAQ